MNFERIKTEEPKISELRSTPLGIQCDVDFNGMQITVRAANSEGPLYVVAGSTARGLPNANELPPRVVQAVRKALATLKENV